MAIARLVFAAAFFVCLALYRYPDRNIACANAATVLFLLGAATDALDGYLARRWGAISTFGRIMDPFCDKVLVLGAFVFLASPVFEVPAWVAEERAQHPDFRLDDVFTGIGGDRRLRIGLRGYPDRLEQRFRSEAV